MNRVLVSSVCAFSIVSIRKIPFQLILLWTLIACVEYHRFIYFISLIFIKKKQTHTLHQRCRHSLSYCERKIFTFEWFHRHTHTHTNPSDSFLSSHKGIKYLNGIASQLVGMPCAIHFLFQGCLIKSGPTKFSNLLDMSSFFYIFIYNFRIPDGVPNVLLTLIEVTITNYSVTRALNEHHMKSILK